MSEHKHTIGPWYLSGSGYDGVWIMAGTLHVATIPRASDGDWCEADAYLMAAAPELLEALESLQRAAFPYLADDETMSAAHAAIAKVKGESDAG